MTRRTISDRFANLISSRREARQRRARRMLFEPLEDRRVFALFQYDASANPGVVSYSLRISGGDLQVVDSAAPTQVLASQPLASTTAVQINGHASAADTFSLNYTPAYGSIPVSFAAGASAGDVLNLDLSAIPVAPVRTLPGLIVLTQAGTAIASDIVNGNTAVPLGGFTYLFTA